MIFKPRHIILFAMSHYLTEDEFNNIFLELYKYKKLTDEKFIRVVSKNFNLKLFIENPIIIEDCWLYNYILYDSKKPETYSPINSNNEIYFKGRFLKKGLIIRYENKIIKPQLKSIISSEVFKKIALV